MDKRSILNYSLLDAYIFCSNLLLQLLPDLIYCVCSGEFITKPPHCCKIRYFYWIIEKVLKTQSIIHLNPRLFIDKAEPAWKKEQTNNKIFVVGGPPTTIILDRKKRDKCVP